MKSLICLSVLLLFACTSTPIKSDLSDESRKEIDSIIRVTPGIDSRPYCWIITRLPETSMG